MSNPLLRPNDPRFSRPNITDDAGKNRFAEPDEAKAVEGSQQTASVFAAGSAADKPYQPRYETTANSRGVYLLALAILGLAGVGTGFSSLVGWSLGWVFPLVSLVASATAWLLAYQDLAAMKSGAMDDEGRTMTRVAMWMGFGGLLAGIASVGTMIWAGLSLLPFFL
jgi:hypothetical protein